MLVPFLLDKVLVNWFHCLHPLTEILVSVRRTLFPLAQCPDYDVPDQFAKIKDLLVFVTHFQHCDGALVIRNS